MKIIIAAIAIITLGIIATTAIMTTAIMTADAPNPYLLKAEELEARAESLEAKAAEHRAESVRVVKDLQQLKIRTKETKAEAASLRAEVDSIFDKAISFTPKYRSIEKKAERLELQEFLARKNSEDSTSNLPLAEVDETRAQAASLRAEAERVIARAREIQAKVHRVTEQAITDYLTRQVTASKKIATHLAEAEQLATEARRLRAQAAIHRRKADGN